MIVKGEPAFPGPVGGYIGMSLRDYFAAQALTMIFVVAEHLDSEMSNEGVAKVAYHVADCMLAERAKG